MPGLRRHRHARADPPPARRAARCAACSPRAAARADAPSACSSGRARVRSRSASSTCVERGLGRRSDTGCRSTGRRGDRAGRRARLRRQAEHPALARAARRSRRSSSRTRRPAGEILALRAGRRRDRQRARRPGARSTAVVDDGARADRRPTCRCSASASATSSSGWPSAATTSRLKFGHRGGNHPVNDLRDRAASHHVAEPRFQVDAGVAAARRRAGRVARSTSTTARSRGCATDELPSSRSSTTPRARPGPQDNQYLFDQLRRRWIERERRRR